MLTDEKIMLNVARGELQQLSVLFDRYKGPIYSFFYRTSRNQMLSEDLTQNVFEKIIKYKHTYKDDTSFKAWIFRIARNVNHDDFRKNKLKLNRNVEISELNIAESNLEATEEKREREHLLYCAIDRLEPLDKETLLLAKIEKMKYADVAKVQGCTESAVKVRVFRAIKKLKEHYYTLDH